ncbi:MAG TPA: hypothetical protein VN852_13610 [Candidatus Krumholzibacteria bacterium]|nr:hypothetical protein [Candidatus Krumholzibacteria bacterium]
MNRQLRAIIAAASVVVLGSATLVSQANAGPRVPQVPVVGGTLQAFFAGIGETINVNTDQQDLSVFQHSASGNALLTLKYQSSPNAATQQVGIYNASAVIPPLFFLLSGSVGPLGFSSMSFKPGNIVTVNRFDANGNFLSQTTFGGVDPTNFGFYLSVPNGTTFSQDYRNVGALPHMLVFAGSGQNAGEFFLCWDEPGTSGTAGDQDFDDCVLILESVSPLATVPSTIGGVKSLYRDK